MPGYGAYRMAALLSRGLPRHAAYGLGRWIAGRFCRLRPQERAGIESNLRRIFRWQGHELSPGELSDLTRQTYDYFGRYLVDFFRMTQVTRAEVDRWVRLDHPEFLSDSQAVGRGVLVVTAHLGNWELGGAVLHALGYPVNVVVMPDRMARLERLLAEQRRQRGMRVLPLGHSALSLVRCLQRGELVALLADRDFTRHHVTLDFFGMPVQLPVGAAWLAEQTGAPILPAFLLREEDDTFRLKLYPPIRPGQPGGVMAIMVQLRDILQAEIARHPTQWFVFHDFWQGEPPA